MTFLRMSGSLLLVLLAAGLASGLEWQSTTLEARAAPFQKTLSLVFPFRNDRPSAVHILELQTNCNCIAARSDKTAYAPGEAGQITAQFSPDDRPGLYERHITLVTDETTSPLRLTVRIEVPELVTLTPLSVEWNMSEELTEKFVLLHATGELHLTLTQATPSNDTFTARLETVEPGRIYRLALRPHTTAAVANAAIRITGHDDHDHEILVSAYANVR